MRGEKDMLLMIVGRKTGREAKETLTLKNMRAWRWDLGSRRVDLRSVRFRPKRC